MKINKKTVAKKVKNPRVPRTHMGGTKTESEFFGMIRSWFRMQWMRTCPHRKEVLKSVKYGRGDKYICMKCTPPKIHPKSNIEVNHKNPVGTLRSFADIEVFYRRLFVNDVSELEAICKGCHLKETHKKGDIE